MTTGVTYRGVGYTDEFNHWSRFGFTRDPKQSIAFHRDVLGMTPTWVDENGGAEFTFEDGTTFGVWKPAETDGATIPGGGFMIAIDDPEAKGRRTTRQGRARERCRWNARMLHGVRPRDHPQAEKLLT